jgi:transposase InsO family protein
LAHEVNDDPGYTLNRELVATEYDESMAEDLILPAGGMALHDIFIAHGSAENCSPHPRRGMTLRLMPTASVYDRDLAERRYQERGGLDMSRHSIFLLRGRDVSGQNDFTVRPAWDDD